MMIQILADMFYPFLGIYRAPRSVLPVDFWRETVEFIEQEERSLRMARMELEMWGQPKRPEPPEYVRKHLFVGASHECRKCGRSEREIDLGKVECV